MEEKRFTIEEEFFQKLYVPLGEEYLQLREIKVKHKGIE